MMKGNAQPMIGWALPFAFDGYPDYAARSPIWLSIFSMKMP